MKNGQAALMSGVNRGIGKEAVPHLAARPPSVEEGVNTPVWGVV